MSESLHNNMPTTLPQGDESANTGVDDTANVLLKKALYGLLQAAEGQEKTLDSAITEVRAQLKSGFPKPTAVSQLNNASMALGSIRRSRADKQLRGFSACVAQLLKLNPPDEIRKELAAFVRHARKFILRPEEQELMSLRLSRVQGRSLDYVVEYLQQHGELQLGAVNSERDQDVLDVESLYEDDSLEGLPPYKTVDQAIEDILLKLLAEIHVPDQAREPWEKANDILSKGLNWYELAALLEQVALVVQYSLKVDQQELELFLQDLNSRLQLLHGGVENMGGINDSIQQCSNSLDANLREGISSLANDVNNASSLDALKASVLTSMDSVIGQLDEFQHEREDLQRQYQEHVASLSARIGELESSSDEVQKELQEQQRRSETDELTGLPNRSAYDRMISLEMARWHRYQQSFSLVVADIDFFKSINDEYGHLAGDKVLAVVAKTIRKRLRRVDFIARYGGEEFVVLLPSTSAVEACRLMEKLGTDIREAPFHYNKSPLRITVSFGIAEVTKQDDLEALFRRADTALYKAKALGRDRAVVGETE